MKRLVPMLVAGTCVTALGAALVIPQTAYSERLITVLFGLFSAVYVAVGALVSARRPANPLGWLMLGMGAMSTAAVLLGAYAGYALLVRPELPLGEQAAWVTSWIYWPVLSGIVLMVLIFPEGLVRGVRTWTARACVVGATLLTVGTAVTPGPMDGFGGVTNPFGMTSAATVLTVMTTASVLVVAGTFVVALVSVFLRLRRATGVERRQLSWFAYAMVLMVVAQGINVPLLGLDDSFLGLIAVVVAIIAFPTAVAVAILRYRLYDIDRIISRTLVYGALTATLVAAYSGSVLLFRVLLDPLTGHSDLAVAASTLAVAALFRPVRARIQVIVDRRFYRSRYDAARTVEVFTGRLRQEVDLDAVTTDLGSVVREAVQPVHVSLWLRGAER